MLIINADDWGRSVGETDVELECFRAGRITSVSAMVFTRDSARAAELANEHGVDAGLHLNFNQSFDGAVPGKIREAHERVSRFMNAGRYTMLLYHPGLSRDFRDVYEAQRDEFQRLYGKAPSHFDGHQHRHLCANVLWGNLLPAGAKVRRNFTFARGEKGLINRTYRSCVDRRLARRHRLTDYLFNLAQCLGRPEFERVVEHARRFNVELETHPCKEAEKAFLLSEQFSELVRGVRLAPYGQLGEPEAQAVCA